MTSFPSPFSCVCTCTLCIAMIYVSLEVRLCCCNTRSWTQPYCYMLNFFCICSQSSSTCKTLQQIYVLIYTLSQKLKYSHSYNLRNLCLLVLHFTIFSSCKPLLEENENLIWIYTQLSRNSHFFCPDVTNTQNSDTYMNHVPTHRHTQPWERVSSCWTVEEEVSVEVGGRYGSGAAGAALWHTKAPASPQLLLLTD